MRARATLMWCDAPQWRGWGVGRRGATEAHERACAHGSSVGARAGWLPAPRRHMPRAAAQAKAAEDAAPVEVVLRLPSYPRILLEGYVRARRAVLRCGGREAACVCGAD